jgi:hypothetical protein
VAGPSGIANDWLDFQTSALGGRSTPPDCEFLLIVPLTLQASQQRNSLLLAGWFRIHLDSIFGFGSGPCLMAIAFHIPVVDRASTLRVGRWRSTMLTNLRSQLLSKSELFSLVDTVQTREFRDPESIPRSTQSWMPREENPRFGIHSTISRTYEGV